MGRLRESTCCGAAPSTRLWSVAQYAKEQKRSRWCRHLQRACGSKQSWEVLAFTGRFDVCFLLAAAQEPDPDAEAKAATESLTEVRRKLHHTKAEAKAAYNKGVRLPSKRKTRRERSASQPARTSMQNHGHALEKYDSGQLRREMNDAVAQFGHGRLVGPSGETLDIGGSTGGGSRRIVDSWEEPDWRQFVVHLLDFEIMG